MPQISLKLARRGIEIKSIKHKIGGLVFYMHCRMTLGGWERGAVHFGLDYREGTSLDEIWDFFIMVKYIKMSFMWTAMEMLYLLVWTWKQWHSIEERQEGHFKYFIHFKYLPISINHEFTSIMYSNIFYPKTLELIGGGWF